MKFRTKTRRDEFGRPTTKLRISRGSKRLRGLKPSYPVEHGPVVVLFENGHPTQAWRERQQAAKRPVSQSFPIISQIVPVSPKPQERR